MPQLSGCDLVATTFTVNGSIPINRLRIVSILVNGTGILTISGTRNGQAKIWWAQPFVATQTFGFFFGEAGLICDGDVGTVIAISVGGLTNLTIFYGA